MEATTSSARSPQALAAAHREAAQHGVGVVGRDAFAGHNHPLGLGDELPGGQRLIEAAGEGGI